MTEMHADEEQVHDRPADAESGDSREGPALQPTGHQAIDQALERLEELPQIDLASHPDVFDTIHGVLRESLANAGRDGVPVDSA